KAYAYMLTPTQSVITQEARLRLSAIEEFNDLGSGFNIAMRDLDIRGAGNLLGAEQSGFIAEVGFEMYQKILDEAIEELKHDEFHDLFKDEEAEHVYSSKDCQIETDLELLIPDHYVTNVDERLNLYHELNKFNNEQDLQHFAEKLKDRFGPIPSATEALLDTIRLKWIAMDIGIEKLVLKNGKLKATFIGSEDQNAFYQSEKFGTILSYVQEHPQKCQFDQKQEGLQLTIQKIGGVQDALQTLQAIMNNQEAVEST
ncbi:MAG: transcription-repair coupling factor, partial [Bacteroidetes bacterium SW_10_40_5]